MTSRPAFAAYWEGELKPSEHTWRPPAVEETGAGCDGPVAIDRPVAERGGACWPLDAGNSSARLAHLDDHHQGRDRIKRGQASAEIIDFGAISISSYGRAVPPLTAVCRERKRAKTDRLDAAMLMRVFLVLRLPLTTASCAVR